MVDEKALKILIIDDFATMRKIVNNYLNKLGYNNVTQAEHAKQGWEILQKQDFDLIISDFNMPEMTGLELLTKVRTEFRHKDQKFIMLTAESDKDLLIDIKKMHVDAYILKPFKIEILEEKNKNYF